MTLLISYQSWINNNHFRVEYIQLALEHNPLNLGQGFPDFAAPDYVTKALADTAVGPNVLLNQYTRGFVSVLNIFLKCIFIINVKCFFRDTHD